MPDCVLVTYYLLHRALRAGDWSVKPLQDYFTTAG